MADLLAILNQSASGLSAFRAMTQTAGHNLANVNTPGYTRQRVDLEAKSAEFVRGGSYLGRGVDVTAVTQSRDAFLERQIPAALSGEARHTAQSDVLESVSVFNPETPGGLGDAVSAFYGSMRQLAQNPGDPALRSQVQVAAHDLAASFNRTSTALEESRTGVDVSLAADVDKVNLLASELASLNGQIAQSRGLGAGAEPNDLLDARRSAQDALAGLTGATAVPDSDGNVNMVLPSGLSLVSGQRAGSLSVEADPANGGHLAIRITRVGAPAPDGLTPPSAFGGRIRGLMDARDGGLKNAVNSVDQLAFDVANALNTQHRAGFDVDGNAGGNMFTVAATAAGAARTISLDAAFAADPRRLAASSTAAGAPGDNTNLQAMVNSERQPLTGGQDVIGAFSGIVGRFGADSRGAKASAEQDKAFAGYLEERRQAVSGVSIDEEIVTMTQAQKAYEAMARVMNTANEMLATLMQLG